MGKKQTNGATSGNKRHRGGRIVGDSDNSGGAPKTAAGEAKPEPKPAVTVSCEIRSTISSANDNNVGAPELARTGPQFETTPVAPERSLRIVINRDSSGDGRLRAAVAGPAKPELAVTEGSGGDLIPSPAATPVADSTLTKVADCLASFRPERSPMALNSPTCLCRTSRFPTPMLSLLRMTVVRSAPSRSLPNSCAASSSASTEKDQEDSDMVRA
jgi:hypothetical protein